MLLWQKIFIVISVGCISGIIAAFLSPPIHRKGGYSMPLPKTPPPPPPKK